MLVLTIGGRLGSDPTLGDANGTKVLNFSVAVDGWDHKAREKITTWVRVAMFGARAEKLSEHLSKGSSVMVSGEGRLSEYKGKQYLELTASAVTLMGSKPADAPAHREQPKRVHRPLKSAAELEDFGDGEPPF